MATTGTGTDSLALPAREGHRRGGKGSRKRRAMEEDGRPGGTMARCAGWVPGTGPARVYHGTAPGGCKKKRLVGGQGLHPWSHPWQLPSRQPSVASGLPCRPWVECSVDRCLVPTSWQARCLFVGRQCTRVAGVGQKKPYRKPCRLFGLQAIDLTYGKSPPGRPPRGRGGPGGSRTLPRTARAWSGSGGCVAVAQFEGIRAPWCPFPWCLVANLCSICHSGRRTAPGRNPGPCHQPVSGSPLARECTLCKSIRPYLSGY